MPRSKLPRPVHFCNCGDHAWTALTLGYVTMVSPEDAHFLQENSWCAKIGRRTIYAKSKGRYLHREILSSPEISDHEDGIGLDNRRKNLRVATHQQNLHNAASHRDGTSKFKGVSWYKNYKKWRAAIYVDGKQNCLGYFECDVEAAATYDTAALKHFGEFARLNFPL